MSAEARSPAGRNNAASANPSDREQIAATLAGESTAYESLVRKYQDRLFHALYRITGSREESEDVAQEAMMRVWKIAPEWRTGEAKVTTWLYRVTANLSTDRLRQRRGTSLDAIDEPIDPSPSAADALQDGARHDALQTALLALPERQRQAVILRHLEELANPEIAQIMEISVEAVESLTSRGKRALAQILEGQKAALGFEGDLQ